VLAQQLDAFFLRFLRFVLPPAMLSHDVTGSAATYDYANSLFLSLFQTLSALSLSLSLPPSSSLSLTHTLSLSLSHTHSIYFLFPPASLAVSRRHGQRGNVKTRKKSRPFRSIFHSISLSLALSLSFSPTFSLFVTLSLSIPVSPYFSLSLSIRPPASNALSRRHGQRSNVQTKKI